MAEAMATMSSGKREDQGAAMAAPIIEKTTVSMPVANAPRMGSAWGRSAMEAIFPVVISFMVMLVVWAGVSSASKNLPGPAITFQAAVQLFSDPFYINTGSDMGIGWQLWSSLKRVAIGFGLAALVGIPVGFIIGRFRFLNRIAMPIISVLKPVSPLAWLPIGLAVFSAANPSAIFVIFITSMWPMIINTALGVSSVPQDYLNVARVLKLSEWKIFTKILLPSSVPFLVTGMRLSIGVAWLVIVAAEMLTGGVGIGFWVWDEWNNLNMPHIVIAIFVIGTVGLILESILAAVARRYDYQSQK
jgi:nitrate/nitrite transport system permease protein